MLKKREIKFSGKDSHGFSMIMAATFIAIVTMLGFGMMNYITSGAKIAKRYEVSVNTLQLAESGIQKALYCLNASGGANCGGLYGDAYIGESGLSLDDGVFEVSVSGNGNEREITAVGIGPTGDNSTIKANMVKAQATSSDTSFDYAMMVQNGAHINNNAEINDGPVYSSANFTCGNNATIEGNVYISLPGGKLDNCDVGGDAYADQIEDSDIGGDCYYDNYWLHSSCGGTKHFSQPTPTPQSLPTLDENFWHAQAESGGVITGNYSPTDNSTLGPVKIEGNLTLNNNVDVTMLGAIWVTGTITLSNNATLLLDPSFGSASSLLMSDSTIDIVNNAEVGGSGEPGSYVIVYSSSTADPAILIHNNAGTSVYLTPNGGTSIENNGGAVAIAAKYVYMKNNAVINYDQTGSLSNIELLIETAGASGWQIDAGTWREL